MFTVHSASSPHEAAIGRALGRIPSGLFVMTAGQMPAVQAMLVSWVQQVGFAPPAISVALGNDRPMLAIVQRRGSFGLSVLGKSQSALFKRFSRPALNSDDPLNGMNVRATPGGETVLADAVAWLECTSLQVLDLKGDHQLLVARITAGAVAGDDPAFTHLRGNGLHY